MLFLNQLTYCINYYTTCAKKCWSMVICQDEASYHSTCIKLFSLIADKFKFKIAYFIHWGPPKILNWQGLQNAAADPANQKL